MKSNHCIYSIRKRKKSGFTLVETLVAISILIIALTGPLAIIAQSLKTSQFSRDEITAAYLAQEPIEYIRNMRDQNGLRESNSSNWLRNTPSESVWLSSDAAGNDFINNPNAKDIKLELVWGGNGYILRRCTGACFVKYDPNVGAVGNSNKVIYGSAIPTLDDSIFTREIYLNKSLSDPETESTIPDRELIITVVVSWRTGAIEHNVTVVERLMNWQLENQS